MKIKIPTNFNYYQDSLIPVGSLVDGVCNQLAQKKGKETYTPTPLTLLRSNLDSYKHLLTSSIARKQNENDDKRNDIILKIFSKSDSDGKISHYIQTGLFTGVVYYQNVAYHIVPHCGDYFLNRMLNLSNHIYLDNEQKKAKKDDNDNPFFYIIVYLFINALEKARILGYPQQYNQQAERVAKYHGQLNIAQFVKKDFPFKGRLSVIFRERQMVQEIVDVLYSALRLVEKTGCLKEKAIRLKGELQPYFSGKFCNINIIRKALKSPSLNNPMFRSFRNTLRYAEIILKNMDLTYNDKTDKNQISGFLIDASELWEVYLEKLLAQHLPDWDICGQDIMPIYPGSFFARNFYPDLVLKKKGANEYAVFDAKFKRMTGRGGDVDREDLHQIHTYASYYEKKGVLKACGLLYPCDCEPKTSWTSTLFNLGGNTNFTINGVNTAAVKVAADNEHNTNIQKWETLQREETFFIARLADCLK